LANVRLSFLVVFECRFVNFSAVVKFSAKDVAAVAQQKLILYDSLTSFLAVFKIGFRLVNRANRIVLNINAVRDFCTKISYKNTQSEQGLIFFPLSPCTLTPFSLSLLMQWRVDTKRIFKIELVTDNWQ
jgi:hypothetical protein